MQDILKQLQEIQEQFSSLFEVDGDGLGSPSADVPPSTNKLKRDVKTKNGKVELVSVEDELFPKEGNAKEQFKQKVLDKINAMIQGTGTLEDLMQVVRAKQVKPVKEGFEGAIEILENIWSQITKVYGDTDKARKLQSKANSNEFNEFMQASKRENRSEEDLDVKRNKTKNKSLEQSYGDKLGRRYEAGDEEINQELYDDESRRATEKSIERYKKKPVKEGFEGAIEILEEIINEVSTEAFKAARREHNKRLNDLYDKQNARTGELFKKHGVEGNTYSAKTPEDVKKAVETEKDIKSDKELADINKAIEKRSAKSSLYANQFRKQREKKDYLKEAQEVLEAVINEVSDKTANSFLEKRVKNAVDKNYNDDELNKKEENAVKALIKRKARQGKELYPNEKAKLEEAQQLLEQIINEVSERTKIDAYKKRANQSKLVGDIAKDTAKWYMDKGAYEPAIEVLKKADTAQKKEFKHRLNTMHHDKAFGQDAYNKAEKELRDEWKAKKDVKEAQELLEEIINEVSVGKLAKAAENSFPKRQEAHRKSTEALKKAHDNYEEQSKEYPEDEPALYNALDKLSSATRKEGEKASHANDLANLNLPKDSKVSANKLFGKADKTYAKRGKAVDKALEKGKGRGDKEFDAPMKKFSRAVDLAVADPVVSRRTNGGANESFEQAISQMEDLINCLEESKSQSVSELFDRPDLIDDVLKTVTGKTVKGHLEATAKKLLTSKKKEKKEQPQIKWQNTQKMQ